MLTIELSWLKILGLVIGQIILFLITIVTTVWKASQFFYNRQLETMRQTIELLDKKASMVDVIEKYHETQAKMLKDEYDRAIRDKDDQRAKEIKALQEQRESLSKQVADLNLQVEDYEKKANVVGVNVSADNFPEIMKIMSRTFPYFSPDVWTSYIAKLYIEFDAIRSKQLNQKRSKERPKDGDTQEET